MDKIKELTFEKACEIKGYKTEDCTITVPPMFPNRHAKAMEAISKIFIMVDAANQIANGGKEWTADFSDPSWKWENWYLFEDLGCSSGFRFNVCVDWTSASYVGSRLCFFGKEVGVSLGKNEHYMKLWNEFALYN
jgi:hypothetical protein